MKNQHVTAKVPACSFTVSPSATTSVPLRSPLELVKSTLQTSGSLPDRARPEAPQPAPGESPGDSIGVVSPGAGSKPVFVVPADSTPATKKPAGEDPALHQPARHVFA